MQHSRYRSQTSVASRGTSPIRKNTIACARGDELKEFIERHGLHWKDEESR